MGITSLVVKAPLAKQEIRVEKSASGFVDGVQQVAAERERRGFDSTVIRSHSAIRPQPVDACFTGVVVPSVSGVAAVGVAAPVAFAAASPVAVVAAASAVAFAAASPVAFAAAPPPVATAAAPPVSVAAALPVVHAGARPSTAKVLCDVCGDNISARFVPVNCPTDGCLSKCHAACARSFLKTKCRACQGNVADTHRDRKETSRLRDDASHSVDQLLASVGAIGSVAVPKKELWEAPKGPLPVKLGDLVKTSFVAPRPVLVNAASAIENMEPCWSSIFIDTSAEYFKNIACSGAAVLGGRSSAPSSRFVVAETGRLYEIMSGVFTNVRMEMLSAACLPGESQTQKIRHVDGSDESAGSTRPMNDVLRAASLYSEQDSRRRARQLVKSVARNLSRMPMEEKNIIRSQFIVDVAKQMESSIASKVGLFRCCDEDRFILVGSEKLHVIISKDRDVLWSGLQCTEDTQVVLMVNPGPHELNIVDARVAKYDVMCSLFPSLGKLLSKEQFVYWSRAFSVVNFSELLAQTVWIASTLGCVFYGVCDFGFRMELPNREGE